MRPKFFYHPFSSYSQKAITAFYEKEIEFEPALFEGNDDVVAEWQALWPIGKFPIMVVGDRMVFEATAIIEFLDALYPETAQMVSADPLLAAEVRMWDRFFDNYVMTPMQRLVDIALGREHDDGGDRWRTALDTAYGVLEKRMTGREWAAGDLFSLADCAAAPSLLYAAWAHPIGDQFAALLAYRARLLARPSYARALEEARPWRDIFPLGAPVGWT